MSDGGWWGKTSPYMSIEEGGLMRIADLNSKLVDPAVVRTTLPYFLCCTPAHMKARSHFEVWLNGVGAGKDS